MFIKKTLKILFFFGIILSYQWAIADQRSDGDPKCFQPLMSEEYSNKNFNERVLVFAIIKGDQEAVRKALSREADPNIPLVFYDPAEFIRLNLVIEMKSSDVVLLPKSAETAFMFEGHSLIFFSTTPLHLAVRYGLSHVVELLLESGARSNTKDDHGRTPFEMLAYSTQIELFQRDSMIKAFIEKSPPPEKDEVISVYHHAVMASNVVVAKALINYGRSYLPEELFYPHSFFTIISNYLPSDSSSAESDIYPYYLRMYELLVEIGVLAPPPFFWERFFSRWRR